MSARRKTPEDDYRRLAERLYLRSREKIKNRDDFDSVFNTYMTSNGQHLTIAQKRELADNTFNKMQKTHTGINSNKNVDTKERKELFSKISLVPAEKEFNILGLTFNKKTKEYKTVYLRRTQNKRGRIIYRTKQGRYGTPESFKNKEIRPTGESVPWM